MRIYEMALGGCIVLGLGACAVPRQVNLSAQTAPAGDFTVGYESGFQASTLVLNEVDADAVDDLVELATDIKSHSETDAEITSIMFILAKACVSVFDEV